MSRTITVPDELETRINEFNASAAAMSEAEDNGTADPDGWAANDDEARSIVDQITDLLDSAQEHHNAT